MQIKRIQVFEYGTLYIDEVYIDSSSNLVRFEKEHYVALSKLNILNNNKYFQTRHNSIKFKQYVGVLHVNGLTIEILPKIDDDKEDEGIWQKVLIEMLQVTRKLKVEKVGEANVCKQKIHLLDLYFEWFLNEVQLLIHQGLIKQYNKETSNVKALKGKLEFAGQISKNLVHKERFYTTHQVYDKDHLIHQILNQALEIVSTLSKGNYLYSKCKTVQLDFPAVKTIKANETTFKKVSKSRKTEPYENALSIARLIILNYAPNVSSGSEKMLALLFDMNSLWEEYILARLKQTEQEISVYGQQSTTLWNGISIRPDIVIEIGEKCNKQTFIIDTKWKNISGGNPSTNDLRQMYVYNDYWKSSKAMLLYPSKKSEFTDFIKFDKNESKENQHQCGLGKISIFKKGKAMLNDKIGAEIIRWFNDLPSTN